ncbi:MAG: NAD-binding protein, partial [Dehalococcoidia bacterium]
GCSPIGSLLACELSEEHNVVLVDSESARFHDLPAGFNGETVAGNILDPRFLNSVEIKKLDLAVVATMDEKVDVMCGQIVMKILKVPKVMLCVMDWQKIDIYKKFNLETISLSRMAVDKIKEEIGR